MTDPKPSVPEWVEMLLDALVASPESPHKVDHWARERALDFLAAVLRECSLQRHEDAFNSPGGRNADELLRWAAAMEGE